jgi:hypothetical protein
MDDTKLVSQLLRDVFALKDALDESPVCGRCQTKPADPAPWLD